MKCEAIIDQLLVADESGAAIDRRLLDEHLSHCESCSDEWHAASVLRSVGRSPVIDPRPDFLAEIIARADSDLATTGRGRTQFWAGAAFGGMVAAALAVAALTLGVVELDSQEDLDVPAIALAIGETRDIHIAIEAERDLRGALINVALPAGVTIAGFGEQQTLSWRTDLDKGINKLTLPIAATGAVDGHLVVRLEHERTNLVFRVDLSVDS